MLTEAVEAYRLGLGERLLAAYALGSLAHGGFSALVSDVDLGLILADPPRPEDSDTIRAIAHRFRSERLSVFWATTAMLRGERDGGRFPALDRLDLILNGRLLAGSDSARADLPHPTPRDLLVSGAEFALGSLAGKAHNDALEDLSDPELIVPRGVRRVTKLVLFPVRFLYTAATGQIGTNDAAVGRYLADDDAPSAELVAAAKRWRSAPPDDWSVASELLREQLLPLYLYYVDDHIARLEAIEEVELADAFRAWRRRLEGGGPAPQGFS